MTNQQGATSGFGGLESMLSNFIGGQHDQVPDDDGHAQDSQVARQLPQDQYVAAARDAFEHISPQEREQFARELQTRAQDHGLTLPATKNVSPAPGSLATAVGDAPTHQPNAMQ